MKKILLGASCLLLTQPLLAEEEITYGWSGTASAGITITTGNTETQNIAADAYIQNEQVKWRHNYFANILQTEEDDNKTGDRFMVGYKADYKLSDVSYIWGEGRYEEDKFSSYDNQMIASTGYGRKIINTDTTQLDLEGGVGYRTSELLDGSDEDEVVFRGALFYNHAFSETASFHQDVVVISGSSNTGIDSKTALRATIAGDFAVEAAYIVKHNTDVLPGTDKTDTTTALSLVYGF